MNSTSFVGGTRMRHRIRSISRSCLAGGAALAAAGSVAYAGELFPYNPPANAPQQMQQRPTQLSAEEMRRIDALARQIARLAPPQKRRVRAEVQNDLNNAASRRDWRQVRFYSELLRRIDSGR